GPLGQRLILDGNDLDRGNRLLLLFGHRLRAASRHQTEEKSQVPGPKSERFSSFRIWDLRLGIWDLGHGCALLGWGRAECRGMARDGSPRGGARAARAWVTS